MFSRASVIAVAVLVLCALGVGGYYAGWIGDRDSALDAQAWEATQAADTAEDYAAYLEARPEGDYAAEATDALTAIDAQAWEDANEAGTIEALEAYLAAWPGGGAAEMAAQGIVALEAEEAAWLAIEEEPTVEGLRAFMAAYPGSKRMDWATDMLDDLAYARLRAAEEADTPEALAAYLADFPEGLGAAEVAERLAYLQGEAAAWAAASDSQNAGALRAYWEAYPDSPNVEAARALFAAQDAAAWETAQGQDTVSAYQAYRETYPDGASYGAAGERIAALIQAQLAAEEAAREADSFTPAWDAYPDQAAVLLAETPEAFLAPHATDHIIGDVNAPVTLVEFFSYACGHCKRFHEGVYQQVLADYVATGKVRVMKREFLLNRNYIGLELTAGAGAQCLETEAQIKQLADIMFTNQSELGESNPYEELLPIFMELGLEEAEAQACMTDDRHRNLIFLRTIKANQLLGVNSTPSLFINGQRYEGGSMDYAALSAALDAAGGF